jgi:ABC-type branched-subunit amino acid transport system substrate-binding protein
VTVAGPEGLLPIGGLFAAAGRSARGTLVATGFLPTGALAPKGRRLAASLAATQHNRSLSPPALYAAQAAAVVLDAIARSDGSRAGVARAVRSTALSAAAIGPVQFDAAGDLRDAPVAIVRARGPGGSRSPLSTAGAELVAVVRGRSLAHR